MKSLTAKLLPILILFSISATAQINSGVGYMHGTYKKGDTAVDYHDEPSMHDHEKVTIIKEKKLTPAEAQKAGLKVPPYMQHQAAAKPDTASTADTTQTAAAAPDTANTQQAATGTSIMTLISEGCDCINMNFLYMAIAIFGLAAIIGMYLISFSVQEKKRPPFASALHSLLATMGLTLFAIYCVYQPGPLASLSILIIAALCGLVLLYNDVTGRPVPKWLAVTHGVLAVVGLGLLIVFACVHR